MNIKKLCPKCGHAITPLDKTCPNCGAKFRWGVSATAKPSVTGAGQPTRKDVIPRPTVQSASSSSPIPPLPEDGAHLKAEREFDKEATQPISLPDTPPPSNQPSDATSISDETFADSEEEFSTASEEDDATSSDGSVWPSDYAPFTDEELVAAISEQSKDINDDQVEHDSSDFLNPTHIPERKFLNLYGLYCGVMILALPFGLGLLAADNYILSRFLEKYWIVVLALCVKIGIDARYAASVLVTLECNASVLQHSNEKIRKQKVKLNVAGALTKCCGVVIGMAMLVMMILSFCHAQWGLGLGALVVGGCLFVGCWAKGSILCAQGWNEAVAKLLMEKFDSEGQLSDISE